MMQKLIDVESRHDEILSLLTDSEVTSDYSRVEVLSKELASLKELAALSKDYRRVNREIEDAQQMASSETDAELLDLAREEIDRLQEREDEIERIVKVALVPKDPNDQKDVIMEIRAGTGGVEAGLFASDLFRMYSRYAQRMGWNREVMSSTESEQGAIKEIVFRVKGQSAFSRLKHESGGHRVQRVPATESSGRLHTSAATVAVLPEAEEIDVNISPDDLQIDIFHSSGHGGQNVQKVATAVRITHVPTGIVAVCQDERSQFKNKEKAMAVLRTRVLAREVQRQQQKITASRRTQVGSGDRSEKVRTYNFPQDRVTDHRVSLTIHNIAEVLDGNIDVVIDALASHELQLKLEEVGA